MSLRDYYDELSAAREERAALLADQGDSEDLVPTKKRGVEALAPAELMRRYARAHMKKERARDDMRAWLSKMKDLRARIDEDISNYNADEAPAFRKYSAAEHELFREILRRSGEEAPE